MRKFLSLLCALLTTAGAWAQDAYYTLDTTGSLQTDNNGYANTGTVTSDGIEWAFNGNGKINPWRLGGKSLTEVDRVAYTQTAMDAAISKVDLTVGTASDITVNSLTLIVASDASFETVLDEVEATSFAANSTITFVPTATESWAVGSYYKFVFNVTVSATANKFVQFSKVEFYKATDSSKENVTLSFPEEEYTANLGEAFAAPALTNESGVTVAYSSSKESVATVDESTGEVTLVGAGFTTITASFAGDDTYNPASAHYSLKVVDPNANDGSAEHPYTVAEARLAIDAGEGVTGVYATGIVSKIVTAYNPTYGNISYNISADGSTEGEQLQAYRGFSYNGEWFTSNYDVMVGDVVVIYGNLKKYNSTYEFDAGNQLVSQVRKPVEVTVGESGYATMYLPYAVKFDGVIPSNDLPTPVGAWTFDDPENPLAGTGTATLTPANHSTSKPTWLETKESLEAAGIQVIDGGLYLPKGSSLLMNTNNGATGFDKYTVMFDICADDVTGYNPLWQNSMTDSKDGSLFIKNGQIGLGGSLGYNGNLIAGQWYRVVLVIDTPNKAALYVDGEYVSSCEHTNSYNQHWLLPEPGAVFFADEDGEEKDIKVTGLSFWDVPFTANQVAALGTVFAEPEVEVVKVPEAVGVWTFDDAENLTAGTGAATMEATSGVVVNEDGSVTVAEGDNLKITTNLPEADLSSYTLMMDVKFPDVARYTALIQTDLDNVADAGLFVHNGQVGINSGGLYYHGALVNDTWYRLVFVVDDLMASEYIDGVLVGKASAQVAKWGISGGGFFLFEDEDDDNDEGVATTTEIRFWDQALTPAQVAALGAIDSELKAYTGVINGEYLILNEVQGTIPALTPVVLKAAPSTYVFNMAKNVAPIEGNDLKGTLEDIDAAGKYVLAQPEGEKVGFYLANGGILTAGKAYLENASGIKAFYFESDGGATAIKTIDNGQQTTVNSQLDNVIFNLAGQRMSKMQRGINIMNGKKIMVK